MSMWSNPNSGEGHISRSNIIAPLRTKKRVRTRIGEAMAGWDKADVTWSPQVRLLSSPSLNYLHKGSLVAQNVTEIKWPHQNWNLVKDLRQFKRVRTVRGYTPSENNLEVAEIVKWTNACKGYPSLQRKDGDRSNVQNFFFGYRNFRHFAVTVLLHLYSIMSH